MCGIAGKIGVFPGSSECSLSLRHRGPDDEGSKVFGVAGASLSVTLFHRRLSIIDLSPAGHQPMSNEDETIWIVFNGEIYNFPELRSQLTSAGHLFRTRTDTEAIIHGYEEWGMDVVTHLRGMFAFAVWDARKKRLFLARDRVGKKPLFYRADDQQFFFASEIKAILATGEVPAELDPVSLHDYLTYFYFPPPRTAFKNIFKLAPATCLSVQVLPDSQLELRQWVFWDPVEVAGSATTLSEQEAIEKTHHLIDEAVRIRLISDVPLGIFLSGGIDSSTVTALAAQHSHEPVRTFSIGFRENKLFDETHYASLVAKAFNTDHCVLQVHARCADALIEVVRHFDEPFGNPTAILEYILTKLMREHVTVALSGDGGDEVFGGYVRYTGAVLGDYYRKLPSFVTKGLGLRLSALMRDDTSGRHGFRRVREFLESAWLPQEDMYLSWLGYFSENEKQELYTPEFASQVAGRDSGDFLRELFRRGSQLEPMNRLGYVDLASFLACNCLEYTDRMSMANSLEVRCPFTDHKLIEFGLGLPYSLKFRHLRTKWVVKEAMRGTLPPTVLKKKKMGFNPPMPEWINHELKPIVGQLLAPKVIERRGIFRPETVARVLSEHAEGKRDNALKIWALLMIEIWQQIYIDREYDSSMDELLALTKSSTIPIACG